MSDAARQAGGRRRRVAVIGAGLGGLALARALHAGGHDVQVFEKAEAPGGRCATRRGGAGRFDHGAPGTRACTPEFAAQLREWESLGALAAHRRDGAPETWAGAPDMQSWPARLAEGLRLRTGTHVAALERLGGDWRLRLEGPGPKAEPPALFDTVALAVAAEEAVPLLSQHDRALGDLARASPSQACWTVMAAWPNPLPLREAPPRDDDPLAPLARAIRQDGRAGQPGAPPQGAGTHWVLHAGAQWSANNLDASPASVARRLLDALSERAGARLARPSWSEAHLWRHAQAAAPRPEPFAWNPALRLGWCGDAWGARDGALGLERAWLSARGLAGAIDEPVP